MKTPNLQLPTPKFSRANELRFAPSATSRCGGRTSLLWLALLGIRSWELGVGV